MGEQSGLILGVECKFVKTDVTLIESIAKKREISIELVKSLLRYNVFTVNQFAKLTGLAISTVTNKNRPTIDKGTGKWDTELDYCFPFSDGETEGPKFIYRNEKAERHLKA